MRIGIATVLIVFGCFSLGAAGGNAPNARNPAYVIGTFCPGLLMLIVGVSLWRTGPEPRMKGWKPLAVGLFAVLALVVGVGSPFLLSRRYTEDKGTSWVYRSPEHGFMITFPSRDWEDITKPNKEPTFF